MENILHLFMNIGMRFWGYCFLCEFCIDALSMLENVYSRVILVTEYIEKFKAILFLVATFSIGKWLPVTTEQNAWYLVPC